MYNFVGFLLGLRGPAKIFEKYFTKKLQKNVDGFFLLDIMRPLLLLQQERFGVVRAVVKPEIQVDEAILICIMRPSRC